MDTVKITISQKKREIIIDSARVSTCLKIHEILIENLLIATSYYESTSCSFWNPQIKMFFEQVNWELSPVLLDQHILERFWNFLQYKKFFKLYWETLWNFDCFSFIKLLCWFDFHDGKFENAKWNISDYTWDFSDLSIWQITFIWTQKWWEDIASYWNSWNYHVVMNLWKGVFMSKLWLSGDIAITSLDELKKVYPVTKVFILSPNNKDFLDSSSFFMSLSILWIWKIEL